MKLRVLCLLSVLVLIVPNVLAVQSKPDFSGAWKLVDYRVGEKAGPEANVLVSGAALNCGHQCSITQTAESLTVSRLPGPQAAKPRDEVLFLDGRPMSNQKTANWDGATLRVSQTFMNIQVAQTITLDKGRLVVVSTVTPSNAGQYRQTYERLSGSR